jgi:hypothetical protein
MTADEELVERLVALEGGETIIVDAGDYEDVELTVADPPQLEEPERHDFGWDEGMLVVHASVSEETVEEYDLVFHTASVSASTSDGEWRPATVRFAEGWKGGAESAEDVDNPWEDWGGESLEIRDSHIVTAGAARYRREALAAIGPVRPQSARRAILVDAVVRYVAGEGRGDVWAEYEGEVDEASLEGFLGWLTAAGLVRLLDEEFEAVFPRRGELIDCTQRVVRDVLHQLRYFRS